MPALEYFLVCRSIQTDVNSNEMSFINVLEDIVPEAFPITIARAIAVSLWTLDEGDSAGDYQATLVVRLPGNNTEKSFPMNLSRGSFRCRAVQGVVDIPIEAPGDIHFEVRLDGQHAASHQVKVHPVGVQALNSGGQTIPSSL